MKKKNTAIIVFVIAILMIGIFSIYVLTVKRESRTLSNFLPNDFLLSKDKQVVINNLPTNNDKNLRLLFWGDVMLDRNVKNKINKNGFDYLFATTSKNQWRFNDYDLVSANLEGAVTNNGEHYAPVFENDFAFAHGVVKQFKKYGFNFFNIANNHLADQGQRGIIETRKNLDSLGFSFVGCEDRIVSEYSSEILNIAGKKIGMIGLSMVYGEFDRKRANALTKTLASSTDLVIVNIHWGTEYQHQFSKLQQQVGHELIDNGADIIIGHHPHVVQGMELYKGKPIFYSLGNFIFDQYFSADTQEGLGVAIELNSDKLFFSFLPTKSKASQVKLMASDDKKNFLNRFSGWSDLDVTTKEEIKLGKLELAL
jgi:poly-gamma-glutamate capsule biosynthesis protein CapA/YwtB (metallophosphatase superfamily)